MSLHQAIERVLAPAPDGGGQAEAMIRRARWAARAFARLDRAAVTRIVDAAAEAGAARADELAEWAVRETGFGVVEHKVLKNRATTAELAEHYRDRDFVGKQVSAGGRLVSLPRPAGIVFALTPSTNPVATVNFKVLLSLMTRNAIIVSPHPAARACSLAAARTLADAATAAGAPDGAVQVIEEPSLPVIERFMGDPEIDVIVATGGTAVVRAAYGSGNPAIGVGPGNAPVLVDATADPARAARHVVDSKSFDNSVLCTSESVLIALESVAEPLSRALQRAGAHLCTPEERGRLRSHLFGDGGFNIAALGKPADVIAEQAGIRVRRETRILLAPIERIGVEEPLSREKLCPVLGFATAESPEAAIAMSRALLRLSGAGHSAAIHSRDPRTIMAFAQAVPALRVVVNTSCSLGAAGYGTELAPSYTIGTGYVGRSSVGDNLQPDHLVHWTRIACPTDPAEPVLDFEGVEPGEPPAAPPPDRVAQLREDIRRMVREELSAALKG